MDLHHLAVAGKRLRVAAHGLQRHAKARSQVENRDRALLLKQAKDF
jgi:hypothetical protein